MYNNWYLLSLLLGTKVIIGDLKKWTRYGPSFQVALSLMENETCEEACMIW